MSVRLAEPPSEVGTGGGQMGAVEWFAAAAVEVAACVELFGVSPGSCKGTCEVFDEEALMPDALLPPVDPFAAPAEIDPVESDNPPGEEDVGTLSGSEPTPLAGAVWASAVVIPSAKVAIRRNGRIAFLLRSAPMATDARQRAKREKEADEVWEG